MSDATTVVGLGEILWDVFPDGPRFGGAPANFACSAAALCREDTRVRMASSVGRDELGDRAIEALSDKSVETSCVQRAEHPTGQVLVQLDSEGHASYEFAADTAWDNIQWSPELEQLATSAHASCFGTLAQRSETSRQTIQRFISKTSASTLRIFDVNLRSPFFSESIILESLKLANVLKLNDEELPVLASICDLTGGTVQLMQQLADRYGLLTVALTRGSRGSILIGGDRVSEHVGVATRVVDTVGAGDAFTATLAIGLLEGLDLDTINRRAGRVAAFVCSQPGAAPLIPRDLIDG